MKKVFHIIFLFSFSVTVTAQVTSENLCYLVNTPESFESFKTNLSRISIVAPQTFLISENGTISGSVDQRILELARENKIKVMPLIVNKSFTPELLHTLLKTRQQGSIP